MGLVIRIEDEHGNACSGDVVDSQRHLERLLPDTTDNPFHCLRFVDPYGDTIFNRIQMPLLRGELDRLRQHAHHEAKSVIDEVELLLQQALQAPTHLYIRFIGD